MITPSLVLNSARELAGHNGTFSENTDSLDISGSFDSGLLQKWRTIAMEAETNGIGVVSALDVLSDPIDLKSGLQTSLEGTVRIRIAKRNTATTCYFFSIDGLTDLLSDAERILTTRKVLVADEFASFNTGTCRFESWTAMAEDEPGKTSFVSVVPRRFVKDLIGNKVPLAIEPFLLMGDIPPPSQVFDTWRVAALKPLLFSLVNEVWEENGKEMISLSGPRTRRLSADYAHIDLQGSFKPATDAARWVYDSGRDVDVRHALLTYELAREWPEDISWAQGFSDRAPHALDAAKTAFQAYVLEISKDTLKSLSDLRKTLSEEIGKVSQQTRELLSTLWRDFVVAVTALLARIALVLADKPAADSIAVRVMLFGTAVFITSSLLLTLSSNYRFMKIAEESRRAWGAKLYGFLSKSDLQDLSDRPLVETTDVYKKTKNLVALLYAVVIIALVLTGAWPSNANVSKPPQSTPQLSTPTPGKVPTQAPASPKDMPSNSPSTKK